MSIRPGEVEVNLDGKIVTLRPTLKAMRSLSRRNGGLNGVMQSLAQQDFDTYVSVVVAGTGAEGQAAKELEDDVYRAGLLNIVHDLIKFVAIVSNGGKPVEDAATPPADADPNGA